MTNHLKGQTSPYLLQHVNNPVDWYPWGNEAFEKARFENKPVFLSIGYSTCHWCHVMAHESFEDTEIADILNNHFISIKVDKEERPDIDSIYMSVCQALTGSGGWPTSIFMTAEQKPFFAGTYFPKDSRRYNIGFKELLWAIQKKWNEDKNTLLQSANEITAEISRTEKTSSASGESLLTEALSYYRQIFDKQYGGFGGAPKFPAPHNLLFLMQQHAKHNEGDALKMAEKTLHQMYRGGLFDHIGYGFSRYSTDRYFLVPHFEKMLYDNALLITAYSYAYDITKNDLYRKIAERTATYVLREMTSPEGGFYSAQDADSDGEEGRFYVFTPKETQNLLGEKDGAAFNNYYEITDEGNFEGKSIPNLLHANEYTDEFDKFLPKIQTYRKERAQLHKDDKILTLWNSLMVAALCMLYKISSKKEYLDAAKRAQQFIVQNLCDGNTLYVSYREGKRSQKGFLDDYAGYGFALLALYDATLDHKFQMRAKEICHKAITDFYDYEHGGFYLYGAENEELIYRPKETYDGAIPSGNSLMACNLVKLQHITEPPAQDESISSILASHLAFMSGIAKKHPAGYAMFLTALSDYLDPPMAITIVKNEPLPDNLSCSIPIGSTIKILDKENNEYKLLNNQTTFYVCHQKSCLPPVNISDFYNEMSSAVNLRL